MIANDKEKFVMLMTAIAELHNKKLSKPLLDIYWHALKKFNLVDIQQAMNQLILDPDVGQFMPKPADIVRYLEGDKETKALQAWSKVTRGIREIGSWGCAEFDDPVIHLIISEMGGWIELCRLSTRELAFRFQEFEKRYKAYQFRNIRNLVDQFEKSNVNFKKLN